MTRLGMLTVTLPSILALWGCADSPGSMPEGDAPDGDAPDGGEDPPDGGPPPDAESYDSGTETLLRIGEIRIRETGIRARFSSDGLPVWHRPVAEEGVCELLEYADGACDETCQRNGFCRDGECLDRPEYLSAGMVRVRGPNVDNVLNPNIPYYHYYAGYDPNRPRPADYFDEGDELTVEASGDLFEGFEIASEGVATLSTSLPEQDVVLENDADYMVRWDAGDEPDAGIRLVIKGGNGGHGLPLKSMLVCNSTDTGALRIPGALIRRLPRIRSVGEIGCLGRDCPKSTLTRFYRQVLIRDDAFIELRVESIVEFGVIHDVP